jgi:uncharacterized membrane protein YgcG
VKYYLSLLIYQIMGFKSIVASHTLMFAAGFVAAKLYDRDELNSYRDSYEKPMTRLRRYAGNALLASAALATMMLMMRIVNAATSSSKQDKIEGGGGGRSGGSGPSTTVIV